MGEKAAAEVFLVVLRNRAIVPKDLERLATNRVYRHPPAFTK